MFYVSLCHHSWASSSFVHSVHYETEHKYTDSNSMLHPIAVSMLGTFTRNPNHSAFLRTSGRNQLHFGPFSGTFGVFRIKRDNFGPIWVEAPGSLGTRSLFGCLWPKTPNPKIWYNSVSSQKTSEKYRLRSLDTHSLDICSHLMYNVFIAAF